MRRKGYWDRQQTRVVDEYENDDDGEDKDDEDELDT